MADHTQEESECDTEPDTLPDVEWNELNVADTPMVVRYEDGYKEDAEMIQGIAAANYPSIQDVYPHTPPGTVTLDLYSEAHYIHPHDSSGYWSGERSIRMITPSDYDGRRDPDNEDRIDDYYTHIIIHEYTHVPQKAALQSGHAYSTPGWFVEGFSEAITVYETNDGLRERYHNRRDSEAMKQNVANGHGYLMLMNTDPWRGSMHVFRYLFEEYSVEKVATMYEQDAENFVEAMDMALGITPIDLQLGWLEYASNEYGGDYSEDIDGLKNASVTPESQNESEKTGNENTSEQPGEDTDSTDTDSDSDSDGDGVKDMVFGGVIGGMLGGAGGYAAGGRTSGDTAGDQNPESE
jgi:hypothetical protein